jgi:predicted metal-dependent phosphoesterase TrpH
MIIDFHSHSNASDGALTPDELIARAVAAGIEQFAITDHDTVSGYQHVAGSGTELPEGFVLRAGVELSCIWAKGLIHIVGLDIDPEHPAMREGLRQLGEARIKRAGTIAERLEKEGFAGALAGAQSVAGDSQIGRPHFAAWMVAEAHVPDASTAFDRYLGTGKIGDVKAFWPELAEVCEWITISGGVAILAHPLKYKYTRMKLRRLVIDFMRSGGTSLEVYSGRQTADQTRQLCLLAEEFELQMSAGSDFHQDWQYGASLGVDTTRLPVLPAVWARP